MILFILPFTLFILVLAEHKLTSKDRKRCLIMWSIFLFIVVGFRANSPAGDYDSYYKTFLNFQGDDWLIWAGISGTGVGFAALCHYIQSYETIVALIALITISIFSFVIYKNTKLPFLALFLLFGYLFYQYIIEQYRQCLALAFVVLAIEYKEKKIKSLSLIILASLFHPTALIGSLIFFIPEKVKQYYIYAAAFVAVFILSTFAESFISIFSFQYIEERHDFYIKYAEKKDVSIGIIDMSMLIRLSIFSLCYYFKDKLKEIKRMEYYMNIYFISLLIYKGFSVVPEMAVRGSIYFSFYEIILSANIVYCLRDKKYVKIIWLILIILSIYRQLRFINEFNDDYSYQLLF